MLDRGTEQMKVQNCQAYFGPKIRFDQPRMHHIKKGQQKDRRKCHLGYISYQFKVGHVEEEQEKNGSNLRCDMLGA